MQQGIPVMMQGAMDVFTLFVIAIIIFNILAPILKGMRSAFSGAANKTDAEARQRLAQSLQRSSAASQSASARAAELARLRRALLASAGVPDQSEDNQSAMQSAVPQAPTIQLQPTATPAAQVAPVVAASQSQPAVAGPARTMRRVQRYVASPTTIALASQDPSPTAGVALPSDWSLQAAGSLMTLESAATAFNQLPPGGGAAAASVADVTTAPLTLLQGPASGMNLFIAAAIVGPCAAFRPLGHSPGGW